MGECGYWHFAREEEGLYTFYQLYNDDPKIWAKGFRLHIDQVITALPRGDMGLKGLKNLFYNVPFDTSQVKYGLSKIGVKNFRILSDTAVMCKIELVDSKDNIFQGWIQAFHIPEENIVERYIEFSKSHDH